MANPERDLVQENSKPASGAVPVVIAHFPGSEEDPNRWRRLIPAWIISGVTHLILIGLFLILNLRLSADTVATQQLIIETAVETETKPPNLENDEIGMDPDLLTNYNVDRLEDVSVPGPVNPNEAVGILNAPEGPPQTIPPPPGFGGIGQGGGVDSSKPGTGNPFGLEGGMGGPLLTPGGFAGRSGSTRAKMLQEGGGNTASEAAVAAGLKWLAAHQAPDGHWSIDGFRNHGKCNCTGEGNQNNDIAGTAFGLLPFLAAGKTHKASSDNNYNKVVEKGLKYLISRQNARGYFGGGFYYAQGLASIAMCEAYGLTADPLLKVSAQKAINDIVRAQNSNGGWDYGSADPTATYPASAPGRTDTSVSGWQLMALKSGQMAGLDVPKKALDAAPRWLDRVMAPDGSGYGYDGPGNAPTMTSVGLLCREYLGWGPRNPGLIKGVQYLTSDDNSPQKMSSNMYYCYYATQVMHHFGGEAWEKWNPKMRDILIARQDKGTDRAHPHQKGSWAPGADNINGAGGRVMMTSLSLLTLEVYYRHLPLYRRDVVTKDDRGGP
jgi:hypothetical protein